MSRHRELSDLFADGTVPSHDVARLSRELHRLGQANEVLEEYYSTEKELRDLELMAREPEGAQSAEDRELAAMAAEEVDDCQERLHALELEVRRFLLPVDEVNDRDVILEVRPGTGGEEASLFAGEIMDMYAHFAAQQGWQFQMLSTSRTSQQEGIRLASAEILGDGVFRRMRWESGVHRVQRVPVTESGGRLHTSTMSVAVLPRAEDVDVELHPGDVKVETFRSRGAGGQSVNTTDSAVRVTHVPTGIAVSMQDERSQHRNRDKAFRVLRARLFEARQREVRKERSQARMSQIGSGERSERIRTFNYQQDRITDHRAGVTRHGVAAMMSGDPSFLDEVHATLARMEEEEMLATLDLD